MNQKALLNGMEYTILDLLPSLDYSDRMVLCQNASGQKYICSKETPQNTQKKKPCGKIPLGRAYIRHSISAADTLI